MEFVNYTYYKGMTSIRHHKTSREVIKKRLRHLGESNWFKVDGKSREKVDRSRKIYMLVNDLEKSYGRSEERTY